MKKSAKIIAISAAALLGVGIVASVAVSAILSPSKYKPIIEQKFKESTGYKLSINGDIGVSLFPLPKAYVENAVVSNGSSQLVEVEVIKIYPQILPLFSGKKQISSISIQKPVITLEKSETGNNWVVPPRPDAPKPKISIDDIEVKDGNIQYINRITGKTQKLEEININASLASLDGPINLSGKLNYNNLPLKLKTSVDNFKAPKIFAEINSKNTSLKLDGTKEGGKIILNSSDLADILGSAGINNPALTGKKVSFNSNFGYAENVVRVSDAKFAFGNTSGLANIALQSVDGATSAGANFAFDKLDIDELTAAKKTAESPSNQQKQATNNGFGITAEVAATAKKLVLKGANYRNLNLVANIEGKTITLRPFSILTPGNGSIEAIGVLTKESRAWTYDGSIDASSNDLRAMLGSSAEKLKNLPAGALKKFSLNSNVTAAIGQTSTINLADMRLMLDSSNIAGALSVTSSKPLDISFKGSIDRINLNNYIKAEAADAGTSGGLQGNKKLNFDWLKNLPVKANFNATIGEVIKADKKYNSVRLAGQASQGQIKLSELAGTNGQISVGAVLELNVKGDRPKLNVDANFGAIKLAALTKTENKAETGANKGGKWSEKLFNFSPADQIDGNIRANISSIIGNKTRFDNVALSARLANGSVLLDKFSGNVYGGSIQMTGELKIAAVPTLKANFSADDINVADALGGTIATFPISGRTSINGNFATAGVHQKSMIENLNGNAAISASNISVRGLDLASFAYNVTNISKDPMAIVALLKTASGASKSSEMSSVGTITAEKGVLKTPGLKLQADAANGVVTGYLDLPKWYMDADAKFNLAVSGGERKTPSFGIHVFGPPDALSKEYDTKELEKYSAEKGILSQKKIDLLKPGGLENKLTEKLNKKLGLEPATQPVTQPTTEATPTPEAAPAAPLSPKEQQKELQRQLINQGIQSLFGQ